MKTERIFPIRKSGGKLGWPRFRMLGNRAGHGGLEFASITIESDDGDGFFSMSLEQAQQLITVLPKAIAFARGKSGATPE